MERAPHQLTHVKFDALGSGEMAGFELLVTSDLTKDLLFVEIYYDGLPLGFVCQDTPENAVQIVLDPGERTLLDARGFLQAVEAAIVELQKYPNRFRGYPPMDEIPTA
jgi:hypothetical protein